jgi:hypothetical protein
MNQIVPNTNTVFNVQNFEIFEKNRREGYLAMIRDYIGAGNDDEIYLQRDKNSAEESILLRNISYARVHRNIMVVFRAMRKNWESDNELTAEEKKVLLDIGYPEEYFRVTAQKILRNPNLFSDKTLSSFCTLYINYFDYTKEHLNKDYWLILQTGTTCGTPCQIL